MTLSCVFSYSFHIDWADKINSFLPSKKLDLSELLMYFPYEENEDQVSDKIMVFPEEIEHDVVKFKMHDDKAKDITVQRESAKAWASSELKMGFTGKKRHKLKIKSTTQSKKSLQQQRFDAAEHALKLYGSHILDKD